MKRAGTAVDDAYGILYERIVKGVYPPGLRMSQIDLARELKTSRTPLREALNRLQANGLVTSTANRGMEVASVSFEETEQMYALRLLTEPPLVAAIVPDLSARDIARMTAALEKMKSTRYNTQAFQDAHHQFHTVVLARYPRAIREMIDAAYLRIMRHQRISFSRPHVPDDFTIVDRHMLEAMRDKKPDLARQLLQYHLIDACLGLALDLHPERVPSSILMAARGIDIHLDCDGAKLARPVAISWQKSGTVSMPAMETVNLRYTPGS